MPRSVLRSTLRLWIPRALLAVQLVVAILMARNWAYVTTYRLYLDARVDSPQQSAAAQQFDIESDHVVPRIVTRGADRIAFHTQVGQDSTIQVGLRPVNRVAYAIRWRDGSVERTLASGNADAPTTITCAYPTGNGVIELASEGPVTWVDPRVVRNLRIGRHLVVLAIAFVGLMLWRRRIPVAAGSESGATRLALFRTATVCSSFVLVLLAAEAALRAAGDRVPGGVAGERHDLGEVMRDVRWEDSPRFGRRLRSGVDVINEWKYGDIVRMGYIPPAVSPSTLHRFRFATDSEGFRNQATRDRFEIAALGDSFTDATTMAIDESWPSQLERRLGVAVQNYGTAGFGPQQELLVLQDYVAAHRPLRVVLAFFAGNDIFDAEAFDDFQRSGGLATRTAPGWRIKDVVSRADTWFVVSAMKAGATWLSRAKPPVVAEAAAPSSAEPAPEAAAAQFDRGMFNVPVNDRVLRWAFMPPYLNTMKFSELELGEGRGWSLTRAAILEMQRVTQSFGGELVVMFLPFKSQVYWPLLERAMSREERVSALQFYLGSDDGAFDLDAMSANRLAQNHLMRELCEQARIPFLDTTASLQERVESGENVYFPDESHLNETGQAVVAAALAGFLDAR